MALDPQNRDRAYLFGRLLAYADYVESKSLYNNNNSNNEQRQSNAIRLMHQFSVRPAATWRTLEEKLVYYYAKLKHNGFWLRREIDAIIDQFEPGDYSNDRLDDSYLLGYHSQLMALRRVPEQNETDNATEGKDEN